MKKTVILLSQSYLQFASEAVLLNLSQQTRLVLVITHNEEVYPFCPQNWQRFIMSMEIRQKAYGLN